MKTTALIIMVGIMLVIGSHLIINADDIVSKTVNSRNQVLDSIE